MPASRDPHAGESLRLLTLGRAVVLDGSGAEVVGQRRRIALLVIVAAAGERGISRDKLMAFLSPERSTDAARHALHQLLYYLRQQCGSALFLGSDPLRINTAVLSHDVVRFDAAVDASDFDTAVTLYGGPFLDGFHLADTGEFDDWASTERARLAARFRSALLALARGARERGDHMAASIWSQRLSAADPLSVPATLETMRTLMAAHDRAGALRMAQDFQRRLHEELGAPPDADVDALAGAIRRAAPAPAPPDVRPVPEPVLVADSSAGAEVEGEVVPSHRDESLPHSLRPGPWTGVTLRWMTALVVVAGMGGAAGVWLARPSGDLVADEPRVIALADVANTAGDSLDYLAQGIGTTVHDALRQGTTLRPVPPGVMRQFPLTTGGERSTARRVGADALLRTYLVRELDTLRLIAELTDRNGVRIGGGRFTIDTMRIQRLTADVVDTIAQAMRLARGARTSAAMRDAEAHLLVLRADHYMLNRDPQSLRRAQALLAEAIERDPLFAEAYSRLSGVYGILGTYGAIPAPHAFELAGAAARRALAIDPAQAMAIANLAHERNVRFWQWDEGERELRRALALEPWRATTWNMLGTSLRMRGRFTEARVAVERARVMEPLARHYTYQVGHVFRCAGQLDSALVWLRRSLVIDPTYVTAHEMIADVQARRGQPDSALAGWRAVAQITADSSLTRSLAGRRGQSGLDSFHVQRARLLLQRMTSPRDDRYVSPFALATLHSAIGDTARAMDLLEQAAAAREPSLPGIACISAFDALRPAPRFAALMRTMHLDTSSEGAR